jgi:hypothetical protein
MSKVVVVMVVVMVDGSKTHLYRVSLCPVILGACRRCRLVRVATTSRPEKAIAPCLRLLPVPRKLLLRGPFPAQFTTLRKSLMYRGGRGGGGSRGGGTLFTICLLHPGV